MRKKIHIQKLYITKAQQKNTKSLGVKILLLQRTLHSVRRETVV